MVPPTYVAADTTSLASICLTRLPKVLAEPSSPGFKKSKSDQRSLKRFSTGVPVIAIRAAAFSSFTFRDLPRSRVFDCLGLVENDQVPFLFS